MCGLQGDKGNDQTERNIENTQKGDTERSVRPEKEVFRNPGFGKEIHVTGKSIKEWLNQPHKRYAEKNELLLQIREVLQKAGYLGYGIDKHDVGTVAHLFETVVGKEKSWIIVREYANGEVNLHSISDSDNILKILE